MKRHSGTMVNIDKATAIKIMLKMKKAFPHIELAISIKDVVERRGNGYLPR